MFRRMSFMKYFNISIFQLHYIIIHYNSREFSVGKRCRRPWGASADHLHSESCQYSKVIEVSPSGLFEGAQSRKRERNVLADVMRRDEVIVKRSGGAPQGEAMKNLMDNFHREVDRGNLWECVCVCVLNWGGAGSGRGEGREGRCHVLTATET